MVQDPLRVRLKVAPKNRPALQGKVGRIIAHRPYNGEREWEVHVNHVRDRTFMMRSDELEQL